MGQMKEHYVQTNNALKLVESEIKPVEFKPGSYMCLIIKDIPHNFLIECKICKNTKPILIGGLEDIDCTMVYLQASLKLHRWSQTKIKTQDPALLSLGLRRFQSSPTFIVKDHKLRYRLLKYIPDHMYCLIIFWSPYSSPNSSVVFLNNNSSNLQGWRISATGTILGMEDSPRVMKKLKLVGTPYKIHKRTAYIDGMFNSQLEVANFEGETIRTLSGIRGKICKPIKTGSNGWRPGGFRAVLEDKPLLSDIVFLRAWTTVNIPKLYNPVAQFISQSHIKTKTILRKEVSLNSKNNDSNLNSNKIGKENYVWTKTATSAHLLRCLNFRKTCKKDSIPQRINLHGTKCSLTKLSSKVKSSSLLAHSTTTITKKKPKLVLLKFSL